MRIEGRPQTGGNINELAIDHHGRGLVDAIAKTVLEDAVGEGRAYGVDSGELTITSTAADQALMLITNGNPDKHLHVGDIIGGMTTLTAPNFVVWRLVQNPTGISGSPSTGAIVNMQSAFPITTDITFEIGGQGFTFTGGSVLGRWISSENDSVLKEWAGGIIISPGDTLGITVQVADISTTLKVISHWTVWLDE